MKKNRHTKWRRLDNTAKIFPIIANEKATNVFRVAVTLKAPIQKQILQQALEDVLPWFDAFQVRLRHGFFWYYFESNKKIPKVEEEKDFPCRYIDPYGNQQFLFRVTYYKNRINLEVFHAITDGSGALNFLQELTYHYVRLLYKTNINEDDYEKPSVDCTSDIEDSYIKNYKKLPTRGYSTRKAYQIKGQSLPLTRLGIIHGIIDLPSLKLVCKEKKASVTQYMCAVLLWSIYKEYFNEQANSRPIILNIPVNLRAFFESTTTMNFFSVMAIEFLSDGQAHTFDEVLERVVLQFKDKLTKENLEKIISYNVAAEKKKIVRFIPLFIKNIGVKITYSKSSKAYTTTFSNLGRIYVLPEFEEYIESFQFVIGASNKQVIKCSACSFGEQLVFTFSSVLEETYVQRAFFRTLTEAGVQVAIESNGVFHERM